MPRVLVSISFDDELDADILAHIKWLKINKPRGVSAWVRNTLRDGMGRGDAAQEQKLDRILELLERGVQVQQAVQPADDGDRRRVAALDKLGL